ncbi:adenosylmethionine decarboxylase [Ferrimonas sediminicola]|uniref:Adenosylmethionine decarboxylase n=1 Tax=Ferrimonas sediminicola TaxID=2569538 RepID=A0A4U1BEF9_9GAMM|nr:adenosylmethionine decarboxylase [Ferrimonas sediminicola]TKB48714.1 adenosylmethionine decarboxylase [Ferrimonas sediminicola]
MLFFEGSEKKIEVVLQPGQPSLRQLEREYWQQVVAKANATILSSVHNEECDAYLLSESSLFVWEDRFLMLTCGTTTLMDAVVSFLEQFPADSLAMLSYQRKNEYQSHLQKSSFEQDVTALQQQIEGVGYQLGYLDGHHNYIYHLDRPYQPREDDATLELLMYHINGDTAQYLRSDNQTLEGIRQRLNWEALLPGFLLDDFLFEPFGYSMNAIKGDRYATMHITPQENSSYVSFETNLEGEAAALVLNALLKTLQPDSYDLISFNQQLQLDHQPGIICVDQATQPLSCGYTMRFSHYLKPPSAERSADRLSL